MGFTKGSKLEPQKCVLKISDEAFVNAFLVAYGVDKNVSFYKMADGQESFLNVLLRLLEIDNESLSKLLSDRLYNKYRSLKDKINQLIKEGISNH